MKTAPLVFLLNTLILLLIFCSCSEDKTQTQPPSPEPVKVLVPEKPAEPAQPVVETTPQKKAGLASLKKLVNRADMREHDQSVWQPAVIGTDFFKHDALQTHEAANALIKYESGSQLELKEKTLVIFDKDPGLADRFSDRVLLKNGELTGVTKKELWVFTNAGLVQIKAVKKNQTAQATLKVNSDRKLKVEVSSGTADVFVKKDTLAIQKYKVAEKSDFEFKSKIEFDSPPDKNVSELKTSAPAECLIDSPVDNADATDDKFEITGRLSDIGAKLLINGELVQIEENLSFKRIISLTEGTNLVVFQLVRSDASVKFYRKNIRKNPKK